ncbi:hypothetical protein [Clostridium diolis]|uniref:hypothetical protein n=1 Tax=Clostridium diolis TaxID=223919 RepID=UPI003AF7174F
MKIKDVEKSQKTKEIQEKFNQIEVDSLDNKVFFEHLVKEEILIISPPIEMGREDENFQTIILDKNILMGGISRKPGNIIFDIEKCITSIIPKVYTAYGIIKQDSSLIRIVGALGVISLFYSDMKIKVSSDQASILMSIWKNYNQSKNVNCDECYKDTNNLREQYNLAALSKNEYERIIDELCRMKCIKLEKNIIIMQERIMISY